MENKGHITLILPTTVQKWTPGDPLGPHAKTAKPVPLTWAKLHQQTRKLQMLWAGFIGGGSVTPPHEAQLTESLAKAASDKNSPGDCSEPAGRPWQSFFSTESSDKTSTLPRAVLTLPSAGSVAHALKPVLRADARAGAFQEHDIG